MKELSIEQKAQRYDEAIKVAKSKIKNDNDHVLYEKDITDIFPELSEIGDDRIRKKLISYFSAIKGFSTLEYNYGITNEDAVAWLEKQSEKTSDKIVEKARTEKQRVLLTETDGSAGIDWDTRSLQDVKLLLEYGLDYIKKLEKQSEQKSAKRPYSYELEEEIEEWLGCEAFPEGTNITPLPKAIEIVRETANHFYDFGRKHPIYKLSSNNI